MTIPHDWAIESSFDGWNEPLITVDKEAGTAVQTGSEIPFRGHAMVTALFEKNGTIQISDGTIKEIFEITAEKL